MLMLPDTLALETLSGPSSFWPNVTGVGLSTEKSSMSPEMGKKVNKPEMILIGQIKYIHDVKTLGREHFVTKVYCLLKGLAMLFTPSGILNLFLNLRAKFRSNPYFKAKNRL